MAQSIYKISAVGLLLFISTSAVAAAPANKEAPYFQVSGTGGLSCGKWAESRRTHNEDQQDLFRQWVIGWVVSYGYYASGNRTRPVDIPDFETVSLWLDTYCTNNPTHLVAQAASALVQQLGGKPALHPWEH